jgi:hypothetical protein
MSWPKPIDHVYIMCDPVKEPDRAAYLNRWLTSKHVGPYTMQLACYGSTLTDFQRSHYNPWLGRKPVPFEQRNYNSYSLNNSEISLVINWAALAQDAVLNGHSVVMMFESDVIFDDAFLPNLTTAMTLLETQGTEWDFLSLSAGADLRPHRTDDKMTPGWFPPSYPYYHTRTCDAMIFKVSMLNKILDTLFPFSEVLDWEMNYQLTLHSSRSLWLDPPIIRQGSGKEYPTTLGRN